MKFVHEPVEANGQSSRDGKWHPCHTQRPHQPVKLHAQIHTLATLAESAAHEQAITPNGSVLIRQSRRGIPSSGSGPSVAAFLGKSGWKPLM